MPEKPGFRSTYWANTSSVSALGGAQQAGQRQGVGNAQRYRGIDPPDSLPTGVLPERCGPAHGLGWR